MRVAIYVRVSTEEQAKEGYSIEGQIQNITDYCKSMNYEITKIYKDEGISGTSIDKRPALLFLLDDCRQNDFDGVVVWKLSRLSRKNKDNIEILDHFESNGISFFSVTEPFDSSMPAGKMLAQVLGAMSELERNTIIENARMGMQQRAKEGKWNGGSVLGYKSINKELMIIEEEALLVRHIFKLYLDGKGYKSIANLLNHDGYKTKRNKPFSITSIRTIILNPMYAGFIRYNKQENWNSKRRSGTNPNPTIVQGIHEPIIDMNTWTSAQLINTKKSSIPAKTFTGSFPLTTLLRCPICNHGMIGHRIKYKDNYIRYYQCGNFHNKGSAVCNANLIRADYAESYVLNKLKLLISDANFLDRTIDTANEKINLIKEPLENALNNILKQKDSIHKNIHKYMSLFENDTIELQSVRSKLQSLEGELSILTEKEHSIRLNLSAPTISSVTDSDIINVLENLTDIIDDISPINLKNLLHSLIEKITFHANSDIKKRTINEIVLYIDTISLNDDYVLTYDTVHHG